MCGIIGYAGGRAASGIVLAGLRRLEYRGYDSAGIALCSADGQGAGEDETGALLLVKTPGKVAELEQLLNGALKEQPQFSAAGAAIGHTRWATHGAPTEANAHPHLSPGGIVAIVHNGIIDNYRALRERLAAAAPKRARSGMWRSETDSEVIAHLIESCYEGDLRAAVARALERIEGTYGLLVMSPLHPDTLVAARHGSPIAVGVCDGETLIASDVSALISHTRRVVYLDDGDILAATAEQFDIASARVRKPCAPVSRRPTDIDWELDEIEKGGYEHFMLKEIHEQPQALANAMRGRLVPGEAAAKLSGLQLSAEELARIDRLIITACGTSMYAGLLGKYLLEDFAGIPVDVMHAAEFRDRNPIIARNAALIAISQSGETADTLAAVREGRRKGATVLGVCNVVGSSIAREAGRGVYAHAGPEISVASTKAFSCQVAVLAMMALLFGRARRLSREEGARMLEELARLPELAQAVLDREGDIAAVAAKFADMNSAFFIGRGYMHPTCLEGALKLKEISYIHAEGYHAAELKHGPIALLGKDTPVIAAAPRRSLSRARTLNAMQECRARRAPLIAIATEGDAETAKLADAAIPIPDCPEFAAPIPVVIAEQLFAYHVAKQRGCEIDQPRNLAKSVTVE